MLLEGLTVYALNKYGIREEYKWTQFPGFSVLCHPKTGKWVALLMRQWDPDAGEMQEVCDLKSGHVVLSERSPEWLSGPSRMKGTNWIGVRFTDETDRGVVLRLFDQAIRLGNPPAKAIVLENPAPETAKPRRPAVCVPSSVQSADGTIDSVGPRTSRASPSLLAVTSKNGAPASRSS